MNENDILLYDLGSVYWAGWFATQSQFAAYTRVIDSLDRYAEDYPLIIVCADSPTNWRNSLTTHLDKEKQYKANRPKKAPEAVTVLRDLVDFLPGIGYPVAICDGYEADDLIATLAKQAKDRYVAIKSEDKDLYQLIDANTVQLTRAGVMTPDTCLRKFGVYPGKMRDWLAIVGDASDNVEGCPKVGPAKAVLLLDRFGSIDGIVKATVDELRELKGIGDTLAANIQWWDPTLARDLVSLKFDAPVSLDELEPLFTASRINEEGGYNFEE